MRLIKYNILKAVFMVFHVLAMYVIPSTYFTIYKALNIPLPFTCNGSVFTCEMAQILLFFLSSFFVGLLCYVGYLKIKISELSVLRRGKPGRLG